MAPDTSPRPADLKRLGRYRIVRPLSKGGMALVYEGRRDSLAGVQPRVAIKLILPEHAGSETFKQLFINEARLGASMHHQNLVQIQDFDSEEDRFFLVMEYVEGLTLRRVIALCDRYGLKIPMGVVAEIGRQACDGLHYAHMATDETGDHLSLVHRDIKPSNLILNPHGVVKVLDFGISKGKLREERTGSVKGTWGYMAPEQATGRGVSPVSDVFGLAVVLFELAALRPVFLDKNKDEIKRLLADDHAARMAATLDADYGPLVRVLIRALQRDPKARYGSAEDFGRALSALLPDPITARDEVVRFFEKVEALEKGRAKSQAPLTNPPESQGSLLVEGSGSDEEVAPVGPVAMLITGIAVLGLAGLLLAALVGVGAMIFGDAGATEPLQAPVSDIVPEPAGPAGEGAPGERRPPPGRPAPADGDGAEADAAEGEAEDLSPPEPVRVKVVRGTPENVEGDQADEGPVVERTASAPRKPHAIPQPVAFGVEGDAPDDEMGLMLVGARQPAEIYVSGQFISRAPLKRKLPPGRYAVSIVADDGRRRALEIEVVAGERVKRIWDFERNSWR